MRNKIIINWKWNKISDFSSKEIHEVLYERTKVFVVEQNCAYQEVDKWDIYSWHLVGRNESNDFVTYARIVFPNSKYILPSIGRIIVNINYRNMGIAKQLLEECIKKCKLEYPNQTIFLQAQHRLKPFYELFGFKVVSDVYDDAGIDHIDMELTY
jgi:ElaA protein